MANLSYLDHLCTKSWMLRCTLCVIPSCSTTLNRACPNRMLWWALFICINPSSAILTSHMPGEDSCVHNPVTAKYASVLDACHASHVRLIRPLAVSPYKQAKCILEWTDASISDIPKAVSAVSPCAPWKYLLLAFVYTYGSVSSCRWLPALQPQSLCWTKGVRVLRWAVEGLAWKYQMYNVTCLIGIYQPFNHNHVEALVTVPGGSWLKMAIKLDLMCGCVLFLHLVILRKHWCELVVIHPF